jgi:hypothetical protein
MGMPTPDEIDSMIKQAAFGCFMFVVFLVSCAFLLGYTWA